MPPLARWRVPLFSATRCAVRGVVQEWPKRELVHFPRGQQHLFVTQVRMLCSLRIAASGGRHESLIYRPQLCYKPGAFGAAIRKHTAFEQSSVPLLPAAVLLPISSPLPGTSLTMCAVCSPPIAA